MVPFINSKARWYKVVCSNQVKEIEKNSGEKGERATL